MKVTVPSAVGMVASVKVKVASDKVIIASGKVLVGVYTWECILFCVNCTDRV
jgi:hypothetical protein